MKDDNLSDLGLGSLVNDQQMEQAETGMEMLASLLATLYKALLTERIPEPLAAQIVLQQHQAFLGKGPLQ